MHFLPIGEVTICRSAGRIALADLREATLHKRAFPVSEEARKAIVCRVCDHRYLDRIGHSFGSNPQFLDNPLPFTALAE